MKPKIVHILSSFPSKSETFIINVITESINQGYASTILANNIVDIHNSSQPNLLKQYQLYQNAQHITPTIPKNKAAKILKALSLIIKQPKTLFYFIKSFDKKKYGAKSGTVKMLYQIYNFLQFPENTVYHGHFGINGIVLAQMKALGVIKGKIITSFYGYDTFATSEDQKKTQQEYKLLFNLVDDILVNSNYLKNNLLALNAPESKIKMIHVGVDVNKFPFIKRNQSKVFKMITVGRLIHLKGQHLGVKVVSELKKRSYLINYTIVGDGEEKENLQKQVETLNLQDEVQLVGAKNQEEIKQYFNENNLFLMTSITDVDGRAEGQGLVTAEAQATGLPVVAFNSGGVGETIENNSTGFLVTDKDVEAMVNKIEVLIKDPNLCQQMGIQARKLVEEKFNNKVQTQKVIENYE